MNSIHQFLAGGVGMFKPEQMAALASGRHEDKMLDNLGLRACLVGNSYARRKFLARSVGALKERIEHRDTAPNISGIYLDVFGFSRGAALARVFCNWRHEEMLHDGQFCLCADTRHF